jgi:hypothetical protein
MSNFFLADRIKETSRVQGTGNISLDGPVSSFSAFKDFYASEDVVFYAITDNVQYEIGSGIFEKDGSTDSVTRNPFRSSKINVGPWYINGTSNSGPTNGNTGYFYPLWLSRSSAEKGVGFSTGPFSSVSGINFNGYPGITFYHIAEHSALGVASLAASGSDYAASGTPVSFGVGVKEVFVTYPGKTSVYNGFGISNNVKEPKQSGIAFWENEQILNYTSNLVWDNSNGFLGINKTPGYSIDVGGSLPNSIIRASGFVDGGSGVLFAGGQLTDTLVTASGGRQFEPFRRNRKGSSAEGVIELSGVVSQIIDFVDQQVATVFAGPISGVCDPCPDGAPSFRRLVVSDLPTRTQVQEAWSMVIQDNLGLDGQNPNVFIAGMIPIYSASGVITYDSGIRFNYATNRLLVGGNASLDTPAYTLDVKGESTISAASGYFNQLIFKDDLIRIGDVNNNTNLGNLSDNYYTVSIGKSASVGASGTFDSIFVGRNAGENVASSSGVVAVGLKALQNSNSTNHTVAIGTEAGAGAKNSDSLVFVGRNAGFSSSGLNNVVAIGDYSASGMRSSTSIVAIGLGSASVASGLSGVVAIGQNSAKGSSGIYSSYLIGDGSASGSFNLNEIVAIGKDVVGETSLLSSSVAVGKNALRYARNSSDVIAIGRDVGLSGLVLTNSIAIGTKSAQNASGVHNIYLGSNAGISVSGNENIEIIASGSNSSLLTHQASGKINVGNTIVGDIYKGRVTIGSPENVNPSATLYVKPKFADDAAFIIQHQGSGSNTPYFQLQSGDGTTFYQITNSGSVITSGYMAPSGGIFLPHDNKPMLISGVGGYMLWNNGGSLVWNGETVGGAGAYANWRLTNGVVTPDAISDGQTVTVTGVSGVEVQYDPNSNFLTISASGLSGVLQNQIIAQTYNFFTLASGNGAGNNVADLRSAGSKLVMSGVNGVNIDYLDLDDGTNSSGVFVIGYDNNNTYTFNVTNGKFANDPILNTETVTISGISGVSAEYSPSTNTFTIGASGLSGVLFETTQNSGNFLRGQILQNTASGLAISGIAAFASGQIVGFTALSAASGLVSANSKIILDPDGSGNIRQLNFPSGVIVIDSFALNRANPSFRTNIKAGPGSILIGSGAGLSSDLVQDNNIINIGKGAGQAQFGTPTGGSVTDSICIGSYAGSIRGSVRVSGENSISIGDSSFPQGNNSISIGNLAGRVDVALNARMESSINIGVLAGYSGVDTIGSNVNIGRNAGFLSSGHNLNVSIGYDAARSSSGCIGMVSVGTNALDGECVEVTYGVAIGRDAAFKSRNSNAIVAIGLNAAKFSSGNNSCVMIGASAGLSGLASNSAVMIGASAGLASFDCDNSIFLGYTAGRNASGIKNSISIQSNLSQDFYWADPTGAPNLFSINDGIQGYVGNAANLHIGRKLDSYSSAGTAIVNWDNIRYSALNITPPASNKAALRLWGCPTTVTVGDLINTVNQQENLFETQYRFADTPANTPTVPYANSNTIINRFGALTLPFASGVSGVEPNQQLMGNGNQAIPKAEGVVALYVIPGVGTGIAICLGTTPQWYKIPTNGAKF